MFERKNSPLLRGGTVRRAVAHDGAGGRSAAAGVENYTYLLNNVFTNL